MLEQPQGELQHVHIIIGYLFMNLSLHYITYWHRFACLLVITKTLLQTVDLLIVSQRKEHILICDFSVLEHNMKGTLINFKGCQKRVDYERLRLIEHNPCAVQNVAGSRPGTTRNLLSVPSLQFGRCQIVNYSQFSQ